MLPGEDGHNCVTRRWHLSWNDINLTRFSFTCKHSTQLTIRTAQGTTGPTITDCKTHTKLYKEGQIISNYILLAHLSTSFNVNMVLYHCHFKIWRSSVLWPGFTGLHLKHRCSLSITPMACLLIRSQKKWAPATSLFNAAFISKLQLESITTINTGQTYKQ